MSDAAAKIFSSEYYDQLYRVEARHWWSLGMRQIEGALVRGCVRPRPRVVLDAGCGTGITLEWLRALGDGQAIFGVELAPQAIAYCRTRGH